MFQQVMDLREMLAQDGPNTINLMLTVQARKEKGLEIELERTKREIAEICGESEEVAKEIAMLRSLTSDKENVSGTKREEEKEKEKEKEKEEEKEKEMEKGKEQQEEEELQFSPAGFRGMSTPYREEQDLCLQTPPNPDDPNFWDVIV